MPGSQERVVDSLSKYETFEYSVKVAEPDTGICPPRVEEIWPPGFKTDTWRLFESDLTLWSRPTMKMLAAQLHFPCESTKKILSDARMACDMTLVKMDDWRSAEDM